MTWSLSWAEAIAVIGVVAAVGITLQAIAHAYWSGLREKDMKHIHNTSKKLEGMMDNIRAQMMDVHEQVTALQTDFNRIHKPPARKKKKKA